MNINDRPNEPATDCPWCGQWTRLEYVQGHYQCRNCKKVVEDCCNGETASVYDLAESEVYGDVPCTDGIDWDALSGKSGG
jgi:hypothetical protein